MPLIIKKDGDLQLISAWLNYMNMIYPGYDLTVLAIATYGLQCDEKYNKLTV